MAVKTVGTNWNRDTRNTIDENDKNLQRQINELVLSNGDSNLEVAQARVDSEGNTYNTLKERLDDKETEFSSQLAQKASKLEVFLKENGININDFDEPTRQTFLEAQGIDVNYVLGKNNVKRENLDYEAVSPDKTTFAKQGKNKFDGHYDMGVALNGSIYTSSSFPEAISVVFKADKLKTYTISKSKDTDRFGVATFVGEPTGGDQANRMINGNSNTDVESVTLTLEGEEDYIVIFVVSSSGGNPPEWLQIEEGSIKTDFSPYDNVDINISLKENSVDATNLKESAIVKTLINGTTNRIISNNVYLNGIYGDTGKTFEDSFTLANGDYIYSDYPTGTKLRIGGTYHFVIKTNVSDPSLADMFRISRRVDGSAVGGSTNSTYLGDGVFGILNYNISDAGDYRLIIWNDSGYEVEVDKVLLSEGAYPIDSNLNGGADGSFEYEGEVVNYSQLEVKKDISGTETIEVRDYNLYPQQPVWGHEYMYSWYEKIFNDSPLKMVWAGDSITLGTGAGGSDYHRSTLGKKILTLGGYPESSITSVNAGHGGQTYAHWIGLADTDNHTDDEEKVPNGGYLEEDMAQNPDLYVIGYGHNDGSSYHFAGSTRQERIDLFEQHLREGLGRIRTSDSFTTGNSYNKSPDELAIIIAMPTSANSPYDVNPQVWNDRIRPIIQKACRDFKCAYVDLTWRQYDHAFSDSWSSSGSSNTPDSTHPNTVATLDYMSMFKDILMPYLLQKN